jgi:predicted TIM-barrel fold metal-dependent hydrolase
MAGVARERLEGFEVAMTDTAQDRTEAEIPWLISVDDHVLEPPDLWTSRLSAKYKDVAPHYERRMVKRPRDQSAVNLQSTFGTAKSQNRFVTDDGDLDDTAEGDVWLYGDTATPILRAVVGVGLPSEGRDLEPMTFDKIRPGCFDREARLKDLDAVHVEKSMCFPQMSRFCGQEFSEGKDKDLGLLCIKAYNDWMVEEWAGLSGGRLIPLCIVPLWDADLAAAEVRRNAERGVHAVTFSESPYFLGLPSIHSPYWDPFFQACNDTDTVICMHIGSSSRLEGASSPDAPVAVTMSLLSNNAMTSLMEFLFSGVLMRYPRLKLSYSESQVGWIPYQLERADEVWKNMTAFAGTNLTEPPSFYYYRQVYGCLFHDFYGLENLAKVGEDNAAFEVDYPHLDTNWPNTVPLFADMVKGLTDEQVYKVARGNAIRMLSLEPDK